MYSFHRIEKIGDKQNNHLGSLSGPSLSNNFCEFNKYDSNSCASNVSELSCTWLKSTSLLSILSPLFHYNAIYVKYFTVFLISITNSEKNTDGSINIDRSIDTWRLNLSDQIRNEVSASLMTFEWMNEQLSQLVMKWVCK